ncbi:DUF1704 domain-containing protein [Erythrobacter sp. NFXS35]|uniref:tyrosine/phenylalanine carboxypeptidase domain-containing protein n=1 Tax=Erythrobacter sp. NFXS35 TaxID=2818436 RepID=UPI0032DF0200
MNMPARNSPATGMCDAAVAVDLALAQMDARVDWLSRLTPINVAEIWEGFVRSNYREMPASRFAEGLQRDAPALREALFALPVEDIQNRLVQALLLEKQREIDRQIELVSMRGRSGFILASMDLFGHASERLLATAEEVLEKVPVFPDDECDAGAAEMAAAARAEVARTRAQHPDFACEVILDPHPGVSLYVSAGNLHIASDYATPTSRIDPLIQHEIGTHAISRHNGRRQPLKVLAGGLADYDELQEGLAVLAEYLAGYFPAERLRTLAARVIAADMAVREAMGPEIFACLVEEHAIPHDTAFDTALRAKRGGGLTKDALYLKGLAELLAYLARGGDLEVLMLGKFALKHLHTIEQLLAEGVLVPPEILPSFLTDGAATQRLAEARETPLHALFHESPAA